jgi:hypothetical protein
MATDNPAAQVVTPPAPAAATPAPVAAPPAPAAAAAPATIDANAIRTEERKRIADIRALGRPGEEQLVQACIDDQSCTADMAAKKLRDAENVKLADRLGKVARDASAPAPSGAPAPQDPESASPRAAARRATSQYYELTGRASVKTPAAAR